MKALQPSRERALVLCSWQTRLQPEEPSLSQQDAAGHKKRCWRRLIGAPRSCGCQTMGVVCSTEEHTPKSLGHHICHTVQVATFWEGRSVYEVRQ